MYRKLLKSIGVLLCIISLVISPSFARAQADPQDVTASDVPAATESVVEASTTLDVTESAASMAVKDSVQETEKTVSNVADEPQQNDVKHYLYLPLIGTPSTDADAVAAVQTQATWQTIKYEGFEGNWPNAGWSTYDCNGTANGNYFWDDESWIAHSGSWSGWPAGNALNPHTSYYPNNACAWMIYGPFSLASAQSARLLFNYWNKSELNRDFISWYVSCNGVNFNGFQTSGNSAGWRAVNLSLNGCLHDSTVWIGYKFTSDYSIVSDGPFIDDVYVQRYQ